MFTGRDVKQTLLLAWVTLLIGSLLWPLAQTGDLLLRDMAVISSPTLHLNNLGFGDLPARNAPQDGVLAMLGFLPVDWIVRLLLVVAAYIGAFGASRLGRAQFLAVTIWFAPGLMEGTGLQRSNPMPSRYTPEIKTRAIELVLRDQAETDTARGAVSRIADELNLSREALRIWVCKHKESGASTPADSVNLEAEKRRLRKELPESQRANEILKKASAFFVAELDRPHKLSSTSSTTTVLTTESSRSSGCTVSTYYAVKSRLASARVIRDNRRAAALHRIYADNYSCYGVRKL